MPSPSYVHGTSTTPLLGETIGENLRRTVERHGDREALVCVAQGYRATWRQLWEQTTRVALGLLAFGVRLLLGRDRILGLGLDRVIADGERPAAGRGGAGGVRQGRVPSEQDVQKCSAGVLHCHLPPIIRAQ